VLGEQEKEVCASSPSVRKDYRRPAVVHAGSKTFLGEPEGRRGSAGNPKRRYTERSREGGGGSQRKRPINETRWAFGGVDPYGAIEKGRTNCGSSTVGRICAGKAGPLSLEQYQRQKERIARGGVRKTSGQLASSGGGHYVASGVREGRTCLQIS